MKKYNQDLVKISAEKLSAEIPGVLVLAMVIVLAFAAILIHHLW